MRILEPLFRNLSAFFLFIQGFCGASLWNSLPQNQWFRPTDCKLTVNNTERSVSGPCVTIKIYGVGKQGSGFKDPPYAQQGKVCVGNECLYLNGDGLYNLTMFVKPGSRITDDDVIRLDITLIQPPTTTSTTSTSPSTTAPTTLRNTTSDDRGIMYGLIVLVIAAIIITAICGFLVLRQFRAASNEAPQEPRTGPPPSKQPPVQEAVPQTRPFQMGTPSIPASEETAHPTGHRSRLSVIKGSDGHRSTLSVIKGSDGHRSTLSVINDSYVEDNSSGSVDSEGYAIY